MGCNHCPPPPPTDAALAAFTLILNRIDRLEALIMSTKDEVLAAIADTKVLAEETKKDVARVIVKLDEAIANQDMTLVSEAVADLRSSVQATDDAAEAAAPEPVEPPTEPEPTPAEPTEPAPPVDDEV